MSAADPFEGQRQWITRALVGGEITERSAAARLSALAKAERKGEPCPDVRGWEPDEVPASTGYTRTEAEQAYPPPPLQTALQIAKEMIEEWDYERDPSGFCHERPVLMTLVEALGQVGEQVLGFPLDGKMVRAALEWLLARHPRKPLALLDGQVHSPGREPGLWVILYFEEGPRYAIWKATGCVYLLDEQTGAVGSDTIFDPRPKVRKGPQ